MKRWERKEKGRTSSEWSVGIEFGIGKMIPSGNRLKEARSCPLYKGSK